MSCRTRKTREPQASHSPTLAPGSPAATPTSRMRQLRPREAPGQRWRSRGRQSRGTSTLVLGTQSWKGYRCAATGRGTLHLWHSRVAMETPQAPGRSPSAPCPPHLVPAGSLCGAKVRRVDGTRGGQLLPPGGAPAPAFHRYLTWVLHTCLIGARPCASATTPVPSFPGRKEGVGARISGAS